MSNLLVDLHFSSSLLRNAPHFRSGLRVDRRCAVNMLLLRTQRVFGPEAHA